MAVWVFVGWGGKGEHGVSTMEAQLFLELLFICLGDLIYGSSTQHFDPLNRGSGTIYLPFMACVFIITVQSTYSLVLSPFLCNRILSI